MKTLKQQFRQILEGGCLSEQEKNHLKRVFKGFINNRDIINRRAAQVESEDEQDQDFHIGGITSGN